LRHTTQYIGQIPEFDPRIFCCVDLIVYLFTSLQISLLFSRLFKISFRVLSHYFSDFFLYLLRQFSHLLYSLFFVLIFLLSILLSSFLSSLTSDPVRLVAFLREQKVPLHVRSKVPVVVLTSTDQRQAPSPSPLSLRNSPGTPADDTSDGGDETEGSVLKIISVPPYITREHSARISPTPTRTGLSEGQGQGSDVHGGSVSLEISFHSQRD
jgi:hypothetical protein